MSNSQSTIDQVEKRLARNLILILPQLKLGVIEEQHFEELFSNLEQLKLLLYKSVTIPRSLASKLFYLQYTVNKELSFFPDSDLKNRIFSRTTMLIVSILNDDYFDWI